MAIVYAVSVCCRCSTAASATAAGIGTSGLDAGGEWFACAAGLAASAPMSCECPRIAGSAHPVESGAVRDDGIHDRITSASFILVGCGRT
ncbi:hypothetical protein [Lysobacter sp. Hz 25]|uniref:hypothetical protein n=1 Tax=Lysobacter sp. Hz 25 TaxID=3383698 RepID=UPI0038D50E56